MTDRLLDLSEEPARLSVRNAQLVIERGEGAAVSVPLADLAALIVAHPQVTFTQAVVSRLVEAGGTVVVCDARRMPCAMVLPLDAHSTQAERFDQQAQAPQPLRKRLWQQLVKAKVNAQGRLLHELHGDDPGLAVLAGKVRSGDPDNIEAQASRRYWPRLFGDAAFRRHRDAEDQNRQLNYGYGVLRAVVARAICGAGLHPSLGLHHHNRYDAFRLADDLMEPLRPRVDAAVADWVARHGAASPLDKNCKQALVAALTARLELADASRTLFDTAARMASSLAAVLDGKRKDLLLPEP
jgi:CRISPR-associated protein Cas1